MLNPKRARVRLAALIRWYRKRTRFFVALLCLCTLTLPPVVVLVLPVAVQVIFAVYLAALPLSLSIAWRVQDSRKHD
jgi:hypothetical protein